MIRLKELREERGWSMKDASRFLKKTYTTYVNHEKGYREPDSDDLVSYSRAYGVSIDYLLGRTEIKNPATIGDGLEESIDLTHLSEDQIISIQDLKKLNPHYQAVARGLIESLVSAQQAGDNQ